MRPATFAGWGQGPDQDEAEGAAASADEPRQVAALLCLDTSLAHLALHVPGAGTFGDPAIDAFGEAGAIGEAKARENKIARSGGCRYQRDRCQDEQCAFHGWAYRLPGSGHGMVEPRLLASS